jgi:anthranilate synthase/phosphoribosyltransferase
MCINAAPMLYIMGKAKDLQEGYNMAITAIEDGKALEKLHAWVTHQNKEPEYGLTTLEKMLEQT